MTICDSPARSEPGRTIAPWIAVALMGSISACQEAVVPAPDIRPVRTVTMECRADEKSVTLTGQVRAQDEVSLAFRINPPAVTDVTKRTFEKAPAPKAAAQQAGPEHERFVSKRSCPLPG